MATWRDVKHATFAGLAFFFGVLLAGCTEQKSPDVPSVSSPPARTEPPPSAKTAATNPAVTTPATNAVTPPTPAAVEEVAIIKTPQGEMVVEFWEDVAP